MKKVVSLIISFILVFLILGLVGNIVLKSTVLDKEYVLNKMNETEYYRSMSEEINSGFEEYIYQSGLPVDIINGIYTDEQVRSDVNSFVDYIYNDRQDFVVSGAEVKATLDERINKYLTEENIKLNEVGRANIDTFEELIVNEYNVKVQISTTVYEGLRNVFLTINKVEGMILGNVGLIIGIVVCVALLAVINKENIISVINYISIPVLSAGIIVKAGLHLVEKTIDFDNILIYSKALTNLVSFTAKKLIVSFSNISTVMIVCGIVVIIIYAIFSQNSSEGKAKNKPIRRRRKNV